MNHYSVPSSGAQRGMALLVSLVFLLLLTLIGISSMQNANLQEKMNSFLLSFSETELKTIEKYNTSCIEVLKDVTADIHKSEKKKSKK